MAERAAAGQGETLVQPAYARHERHDGHARQREHAREYFDAAVTYEAPCTSPTRREAFLKLGPKVLEFLEQRGMKFFRPEGWADYYDDLPGGEPRSRSVILYRQNRLN